MTSDADTDNSSDSDAGFSNLRTKGYLSLMGGKLCELKDTEDEVREIGKILNAPENALQLLEKASKSNVFAFNKDTRLDDYRYLIFSCHGILPDEITQITQPALALSHPDPADKNADGFLTMADTFALKLNAELVVLSACNTGMGEQVRGEGIMGLTRAFMYAGTPGVSVTLWSVDSKSSKELSAGLFEELEAGKPRAEALRQIKCDMIHGKHGEIMRHPFFWSPLVIFGDGR